MFFFPCADVSRPIVFLPAFANVPLVVIDLTEYNQSFKVIVNTESILAYSNLWKHERGMRSSCFSVGGKN